MSKLEKLSEQFYDELSTEEGISQSRFQKYLEVCQKLTETKDASKLDRKFKKKTGLTFTTIDINSKEALKYITKEWLNGKYGEIAICDQDDKLAGFIYVNKSGVIAPLKVMEPYRGYGVSDILLKDAIEKFKGKSLGVYSDNQVAMNLYKKHGFKAYDKKVYKDGDTVILMKR